MRYFMAIYAGAPVKLDDNPPSSNFYTASQDFIFPTKIGRSHGIFLRHADSTPSAMTITAAAATDLITSSSHGCGLGLKGRFTTTTTLPAGLLVLTDYFVIPVDTNTFKVATSRANALAGVYVDILDAGTGTHTFTPTSASGLSIQLSFSADGTNYTSTYTIDNGTDVTLAALTPSTVANKFYNLVNLRHITSLKVALAITAGQVTLTGSVSAMPA
jgi:hypothetical protein